ncbi:DUF2391 domain-containing protein [Haloplanus sp. GCM10025708]|uniref:DUF2391 domain-containing protein n=1 Tax=Haloferacaceae TaxID=1644056 RepID=UPI00362232F6
MAASDEESDVTEIRQELEAIADTPEERERVREAVEELTQRGVFGRVIVGFDRGDVAEALLGSVVFGIPMLVEGGTQEVGLFLADHLLAIEATLAATVAMVVGILYVSDIQDVRIHEPFFGFLPRRLVGVLGISFGTALVMMTLWGRTDWSTPWVAFAQVTVAFVPMAIGASLSDILSGT